MRSTLSTFNEVWQCQFKQYLLKQLDQFAADAKIVLACSGGMDSMLLLYLFAELIPSRLLVVSIDHQLQQNSHLWSQQVATTCQQLQIACQIIPVQVLPNGNLEQQARQARYQALNQQLQANDILVLAHHQQDQAETVMLRLLQGTGVKGLAAMQLLEQRACVNSQNDDYFLWRPLLNLSRAQINDWVQQLAIDYVDDPMNRDLHYDRVWCRESLWPVLTQRFPKMQDSIVRCAALMYDAYDILQEVLQADIQQCIDLEQRVLLPQLAALSLARQRQLLSYWMQADADYRPPLAMVQRLQNEVIAARSDAQSVLHYADYYFVRFDAMLYRYSDTAWLAFQHSLTICDVQFDWAQCTQIALGQVMVQSAEVGIDPALLSKDLSLVPRQGGEKIEFYARTGTRILKKELQAAKIAPWFRHQIQILMYHNTILGVFTPKGFWLAASPYCRVQGWLPKIDFIR